MTRSNENRDESAGRTSNRRTFLGAVAGTTAVLAGCNSEDAERRTAEPEATGTTTATATGSPSPTETPSPTPSDAAIEHLDTARDELTAAFAMLRKANVYDVENRLYHLDFEALGAFDPDPVLDRISTATNALHGAREELRDEAPKQHTVNALLSLTVIGRAGANLYPEIQTTYTGVWNGLRARQRGDDAEALEHMKEVIQTPERWKAPAEELTDGVKSMTATGYPPGVGEFESLRWVKVARLAREAPSEFRRIGLAQEAFTKADVSYFDGLFAFDDEDWDTAIRNFEVAQPLYYTAYDNAASLRDDDTYGFYQTIVDAHFCKGSKMRRASRYLMQAAEAYSNGDTETGEEKEERGREEVVEGGNNCTKFPTTR